MSESETLAKDLSSFFQLKLFVNVREVIKTKIKFKNQYSGLNKTQACSLYPSAKRQGKEDFYFLTLFLKGSSDVFLKMFSGIT